MLVNIPNRRRPGTFYTLRGMTYRVVRQERSINMGDRQLFTTILRPVQKRAN